MNKVFKIVFNTVRGKMMVVNEATSSIQAGKKSAVAVAVIGALLSAGSVVAADLGHFTEADNGTTIKAETYLGNDLGRWDGRDITIDGNTEITIESSGLSFGKVTGENATINFVTDRAYGLSTGILIDGNMNAATNYATGPMTVKVKKMTVTNTVEHDSQYGIWAQNKDESGVNLSVEAETVEVTAIKNAISLHSGAVAEFKNVSELTAIASENNALRVVGGSALTITGADGAKIVAKGGNDGEGIYVYDDRSSMTINNDNGTNEVSSVLNKGSLAVFGDTTVSEDFDNQNTFNGSKLTVKGGFKNSETGIVNVEELTLDHPDWATPSNYSIQGTINASEKFVYSVGGFEGIEIDAAITTKRFEIQGGSVHMGPIITSNDVLANVGEIFIESAGQKTGFLVEEDTAINFDKTVTFAGNGDARIQVRKGGSMTIGTLVNEAAHGKLQLDDASSEATVKSINVKEGELNLEVLGNKSAGNATFNIGNIDVGVGARFSASVYNNDQPNIALNGIDGVMTINLGDEAIVDFGGVKNNDWRSDKISVSADQITVNVANIDKAGNVYLSKEGTNLEKTSVLVNADGSNNTGDVTADLEKMADIVSLTSNTDTSSGSETNAPATMSSAVGTKLSIGEGMYGGAATATVGEDGALTDVNIQTNSVMSNVLDLATNQSVALTRILTNDVRKRLGDLRSSEGAHGVWARYDGGKFSGTNDYENDFTTIQLGVDTVPSVDSPRFGIAFAYTTSDADLKRGSADMDAFSLALYGTKLYDNGMFVDVIGRLATTDTDVIVDGNKKGSMDNLALSLSGEFGWRFNVTDMFYVEPQTELAYAYVNSDSLGLSDGSSYEFDSVDSLTGRVGFAAGIQCPDNFGDVYVRASAVHEFLGDAEVRGAVGDPLKVDGKDTWIEFGIGANFNINKSTYIYADIERTGGATLDEDWRGNVGVRYAW